VKNAYYQDELRYLRETGPEVARANPEVARYLADRGSDPDVERLLEGAAFLCGRIREKLDDELPEFTASMMGLLWPHYLRSVPSMAIVQLRPDMAQLQAPVYVNAGCTFASTPVDGTRCVYRACWPVTVRPWSIEDVRLETEPGKPVRFILTFRCAAGLNAADLDLGTVRLHLAGDTATAFTLFQLLAAHVHQAAVTTVDSGSPALPSKSPALPGRKRFELGSDAITAAGQTGEEGLIPYPARSFLGYRFVQEYFAFKERFLFVDVAGMDRAVAEIEPGDALRLSVTLNRRLDSFPRVSTDNVRLHCVPVINLFQHPGEPIRVRHDRVRYLLHPSKVGVADRRHVEVYSIDSVTAVTQGAAVQTRPVPPFYSFAHASAGDPRKVSYYHYEVVPCVQRDDPRLCTDTYVSFVGAQAPGQMPADETMSFELTCTNRDLPGQLRAGDICQPTDSSPASVEFSNLGKPTETIRPPLGKALHWRLISHMSLNYVSLTTVDHFRELLRVYDFQSEHDAQRAAAHARLLEGIVHVSARYHERMVRGTPLRGCQVELELSEEHFAGEGDAYVFACVVDRFLAQYVTLNSFSQLSVRFARSGQRYAFPPRWGEQFTPAEERAVE